MAKDQAAAPSPITDREKAHEHPKYREAWSKLMDLRTQRHEAEMAIRQECEAREASRHSGRHAAAAERLLAGDAPAPACPAVDIPAVRESILVLDAAIEIQEGRVAAVETSVSREIIERIRPRYAALVARQFAAAKALHALIAEEHALVAALSDGGTRFGGLTPVSFRSPSADQLERFQVEALEHHGLTLS